MAYTYSKIASVTIGSGGSPSIDFIAIPQTYTDLRILFSSRITGSGNFVMRFNSITSGYSGRRLAGNGSTLSSDTISGQNGSSGNSFYTGVTAGTGATANAFGNSLIHIPSYTNNVYYKTMYSDAIQETNGSVAYQEMLVGTVTNASPITSIQFLPWNPGDTFNQYTTATLYGIKAEV